MFFSTVAITAFAALAAASPVKRGFGGEATYYATGLGACGQVSSDSDFIVALNAPQYGSGYPGPECFKQVQISANGKTATATVMDLCPGCAYGDLDMSPSLFNHFSDPAVGRFPITWEWAGSAPAPAATSEAPKTSSTAEPTPSSTWVAPTSSSVEPTTASETPSSTWVAPSSSTAESKTESASSSVAPSSSPAPVQYGVQTESTQASSSAVSASSAPASSEAVSSATSTVSAPIPTITVGLDGNQTLAELYAAVAQMGELVIVGASNSSSNATAAPLSNTTIIFE